MVIVMNTPDSRVEVAGDRAGSSPAAQQTVLLITPFFSPNIGGVETRFDNITAYLDRRGIRVEVLTYQPIVTRGARGARREQRGERTRIRRMRWPGGDRFHRLLDRPLVCALYLCPGLLWMGFWYLLRHRREVNVIHAPGFNAALVARILKGLFGIPYVVTVHALYNFPSGSRAARMARWVLSGARRVMALSESSRQDILSVGLPPEQVGVHINWIDTDRFSPRDKIECRKQLGLPADGFIVVMVGRLKRIKGVEIVLELAEKLDLPDLHVVIAGDGDMADACAAAADRLPRLTFMGTVPNEKLPDVYSTADISLIPSIYPEGFSRVVLESLSCGIPVVASRIGCIPEEVDETCALLVEPQADAFRDGVKTLYNDRKRLAAMAIAARQFGAEHYSERNMDTLIDAYGLN